MACCVPQLESDGCGTGGWVVGVGSMDVVQVHYNGCKVNTDGGQVGVIKGVVAELIDQAGLTDTLVAQEDQFIFLDGSNAAVTAIN